MAQKSRWIYRESLKSCPNFTSCIIKFAVFFTLPASRTILRHRWITFHMRSRSISNLCALGCFTMSNMADVSVCKLWGTTMMLSYDLSSSTREQVNISTPVDKIPSCLVCFDGLASSYIRNKILWNFEKKTCSQQFSRKFLICRRKFGNVWKLIRLFSSSGQDRSRFSTELLNETEHSLQRVFLIMIIVCNWLKWYWYGRMSRQSMKVARRIDLSRWIDIGNPRYPNSRMLSFN